MNDDCIEFVLKLCDADSLISVSQTCKKLNIIATPLFRFQTSYRCLVETREDENRVKRTINFIGKYLTELHFHSSKTYQLSNDFFERLPQKCPNLQLMKTVSNISLSVVFGAAHTLQQLKNLFISCLKNPSIFAYVGELPTTGDLQVLKSLYLPLYTMQNFVRTNLGPYYCAINGTSLEVDYPFLERFNSSENPTAIIKQLYSERQPIRKNYYFI